MVDRMTAQPRLPGRLSKSRGGIVRSETSALSIEDRADAAFIRHATKVALLPALLVIVLPFVLPAGCGLGYIDIVPEETMTLRVENGTPDGVSITVTVEGPEITESEDTDADKTSSDTVIYVLGGNTSVGSVPCDETITIAAVMSDSSSTAVAFSGDGTGTPGFDSGSVGASGQRHLIRDTHFTCADSILIQLSSSGSGTVVVVEEGESFPDPVTTSDETDPTEGSEPATVRLQLENATATAADVTIATGTSEEEGETTTGQPVRVPAGQYTTGEVACGADYVISGTMAGDDSAALLFSGDGTGTAGFDSASVGLDGERLLAFLEHYACGETVVIRIEDDGSGIGSSTSETPLGTVAVYAANETVPEPDLPDPDDETPVTDAADEVTLVIVNAVESTIQINFATGNGSLADTGGTDISSSTDVRVPPGSTSFGTGSCAQEYMIAGAHLETTGTTYSEGGGDIFEGGGSVNFHGIVFTGDGTGTEGFDGNSIAVSRGRLFQLGTHFECGDTITVTVTATNNQVKVDEDGVAEVDEYGEPTIGYGVGTGTVSVTAGGS